MKKVTAAVAAVLVIVLGAFMLGRYSRESRQPSQQAGNRRVLYWVDTMHPDYKSDHPGIAPDCGMPLEPVYADDANHAPASLLTKLPQGVVSIDGTTQELLGIRMATVERNVAPHIIRVLGRVAPEDTRVYRINSGTEGFVRETYNDSVGVRVKKDQKLATFYGPELLSVASGFLSATERVPGSVGKDGSRTMPFPGAVSKQGVSSIQGYTDRLRNLGMSDVQIRQVAESGKLPDGIDIVAPTDGFILARNITPSQHFDHATEFYRIADLSQIWLLADVFGSEAQSVHPGSTARVTLPGQGKILTARVTDVLPEVDPATRTLKVRLVADNPGFALRPDMYVDVELQVAMPAGLTVPQDAVLDSGREQRVFVERSSGVFEPRAVQTGWRSGDRVEIVHGLAEGERVVGAGTFLVDSESRLKSIAQAPAKHLPDEKDADRSKSERGSLAANAGKVKDAACGMMIDRAKAVAEGNTVTRDGGTYYFCSDRCKKKFGVQPEHYIASNPSEARQ